MQDAGPSVSRNSFRATWQVSAQLWRTYLPSELKFAAREVKSDRRLLTNGLSEAYSAGRTDSADAGGVARSARHRTSHRRSYVTLCAICGASAESGLSRCQRLLLTARRPHRTIARFTLGASRCAGSAGISYETLCRSRIRGTA